MSRTKCKYCLQILEGEERNIGFHKECHKEIIKINKNQLQFKYNPVPRKLKPFPTQAQFRRPEPEKIEEIQPLSLTEEELAQRGDSTLYKVTEISKDLAMLALPWKQREAVKVGWKITKFIAGKK